MTLTRRRFLTISAGFALAPVGAQANTWQGRAFGADVSITIRSERDSANAALTEARQAIRDIEALFSLYDDSSAVSQLNLNGALSAPDLRFVELMEASDHAYKVTDGLFDPTVQRLWQMLAKGYKPTEYFDTIGWDRVRFNTTQITLDKMQALTFNGIAQGYATDKVTEVLHAHGLGDVLVNIGEHRGTGGPWNLALQDPAHGVLGFRTLTTGAIATSSPHATPMGADGHIIHGTERARWSTVSVEAPNATLADSLSTAMVLARRDQIEAIKDQADVTRVTLVDFDGNLITL
ncbi:FAD:protein FMN transferase [uncultured Sulfitobacter sp.]|uniref:FAD:protein FMN transferase n=1 Tax=uncultured Sulfitobacter sp. TaxID=191468 RepID=UPI00260976A3|nr:FAD:protein FMN transferase [uncultured Sulfitobacter sp.]